MKKKKNTKSKDSVTVLITILFLLACTYGAYYSIKNFYGSINNSLRKMNERPIATIQFKRKTAQRKFEERMVWDRLKQNSPVYDGDTIRTAPESEATIYFRDGNIMELGENTMAQIFFRDGMAQTSVQSGDIVVNSTNASNGAVISFGNSLVELNAGSSFVGTDIFEDGSATINVMGGEAVFKNADGTIKTITEGDSLALDSKSEERIIPLITVMQPKPNEKILNFEGGEGYNVDFKWNVKNLSVDDYLVLEIASDKKFENIVQTQELKNLKNLKIDLQNGAYHWRIFPKNAGTNFSAQSKLNILNVPKPQLISPEKKANFSYKTNSPDVRFAWTQNEWVTAFDFEIADNPQMNSPVVKQRISTPSSIVSSLEGGTWYWRVTPYYTINNLGLASPSEVREFKINKMNSLAEVELILPASDDIVNTAQNDSINFSWKNNAEVGEYEIIVASDSHFAEEKIRQRRKNNFLNVKASDLGMQTGTWYWYVCQYNKDGVYENKSEVRKFSTEKLEFELRAIYPPENFSVNNENIMALQFSWKTNIPGDKIFQIARDKNFKNIVVNETNSEQYFQGAKLEGGNYYWKVVSKDNPKKYSTSPRVFKVITVNLDKPILVSPIKNTTLEITQDSKTTFTWKDVEGADFYLFKLYKKDNPKNILYSEKVSTINCSVDLTKFSDARYSWSVQAATNATETFVGKVSEPSEENFRINQVHALQLLYPKNGARIDGLVALEKPGVVRWSSEQETKNAVFTLSKNQNGYSNPIVSIKNPKREIQLPHLEAGTYYWTVRAQNKKGSDISPQVANNFIVNKIDLLPAPILTGPAATKNATFNVEQIRKSRKIEFSWKPVKGADKYIFTLRNERGEVLIAHSLNETHYQINDMGNLGGGKFNWSVQATQILSDGKTTRDSIIAANTFTIDVPEIEDIIINDTGILYGM